MKAPNLDKPENTKNKKQNSNLPAKGTQAGNYEILKIQKSIPHVQDKTDKFNSFICFFKYLYLFFVS